MKKRKNGILAGAAAVIFCLAVWIIMLYAQKAREERAWEQEVLTRYYGGLNDAVHHLSGFREADSYDEQISCLQAVIKDLLQLKAYMEMHIHLAGVSTWGETEDADPAGWKKAESVAGLIVNGGTVNSRETESFLADGVISEQEAAVMEFLREETEGLYRDMTETEEGGDYRYVLSSGEVYRRLTEIMTDAHARLIQINR